MVFDVAVDGSTVVFASVAASVSYPTTAAARPRMYAGKLALFALVLEDETFGLYGLGRFCCWQVAAQIRLKEGEAHLFGIRSPWRIVRSRFYVTSASHVEVRSSSNSRIGSTSRSLLAEFLLWLLLYLPLLHV